jgi:hypothetical protein
VGLPVRLFVRVIRALLWIAFTVGLIALIGLLCTIFNVG